MFRTIRRLQASGHFSRMHRVAPVVCVTRDEQDGGIGATVLHAMVGGIAEQVMEVLLILR